MGIVSKNTSKFLLTMIDWGVFGNRILAIPSAAYRQNTQLYQRASSP